MHAGGDGSGAGIGAAASGASEPARSASLVAARLKLPFLLHPGREGWRAKPLPGEGQTPASIAAAIRAGDATLAERDGETRLLVAADPDHTDRLAMALARRPALAGQMAIATPAAIRRMLLAIYRMMLLKDAVTRLQTRFPRLSAARLATAPQIAVLAMLVAAIAAAIALFGMQALAVIDILAGVLFLAVIILRMEAIGLTLHRRRQKPPPPARADARDLPVYTILLPLHDEAGMVGQLVAAIDRLEWPRDRLDVKLIVEADDRKTIAAIRRLRLAPCYEVIRVPPMAPRTKPKALAFALPLARGDYVTVYDAEDRPDPLQLIEAHAAFAAAGPELGCLQAPLVIDNGAENGLTALFALEYSVQFDGVLPLLAALDMPLPLGGTSNHFRRAALERVGGWDPFNVTEDADLGIRLARFGYRSAMIERPTFEAAPRRIGAWLAQRTRWLKGWMQTLLVHMRDPALLVREIGWKRTAGFLLTSLGSLVAAAVHPLYLATAIAALLDPGRVLRADTPLFTIVTALNLFNFVAAYGVFAMLSRQTFLLRGMERPASALVYLPGYWLLLSLACYRAVVELIVAPHHWSKTPHLPTIRSEAAPAAAASAAPAKASLAMESPAAVG